MKMVWERRSHAFLPHHIPGCDKIKNQNSVTSYRSKSAAKEEKRLEMKLSPHRDARTT